MKLTLRSLLIWLFLLPAIAISMILQMVTNIRFDISCMIGLAVWWPILFLLIQLEGRSTKLGRALTKIIGPLMP